MSALTLVGVWAHPDDEAYLSAGLMAQFRLLGHRVVVVTATNGEHGTADPQNWPPQRLAQLRECELRSSLAAVDVHELHLLGYEDGTCQQHDGTDVLARRLADIQPDLIVTFGPDGMTGHPDHRAVSEWTTRARAAACPAAGLWHATLTAEFHEQWGDLNKRIGLWDDQPHPPCVTPAELVSCHHLSDDLLDRKAAALAAHWSQTAPLIDLVGADAYRHWWSTEAFRLAPETNTNPRTKSLSRSIATT